MDFKVYILFSETKNRFYIGYTSNIEARILRHNQRSKDYKCNINDWKVVYQDKPSLDVNFQIETSISTIFNEYWKPILGEQSSIYEDAKDVQ